MIAAPRRPRLAGRDRSELVVGAVGAAFAALIAASIVVGTDPAIPTALVVAALVGAALQSWLLRWSTMVSGIVLVILFIPIRRYQLPAALPINLEPYRLAVAVVMVLWLASLLVQRDMRLRRTGFEAPVLAFGLSVLLGVAANTGRIHALGVNQEVMKKCTFFLSFFLVMWLVTSVIARRSDIDRLVKVLVGGGAVVAFLALVESRTNYNVFDHLQQAFPLLHFDPTGTPKWGGDRGGRVRAYASAQHSIALGAALVMLVPLAYYLARRTRAPVWWVALGLLGLGAFTTVSRTAMLMLVVEAAILLRQKPKTVKKMWPLLLPLLVAVHVAVPGTLGAFKESFFPKGGLIAEQQQGAGTYGSGRIADLGPGMKEFSRAPVLGQGFGTRITDRSDPKVNAPILDDEWLGTLLETGAAGALAFLWLILRATRRLGKASRADDTDRGWLLAGLAAAIGAFGFGMLTYDAFSFIQVSFLFFIMLGIAGAELNTRRSLATLADDAPAPAGRPSAPVRRTRRPAPSHAPVPSYARVLPERVG